MTRRRGRIASAMEEKMIEADRLQRIAALFPRLAAEKELFAELGRRASVVGLEAGETVCHQSSQCSHLPLVLSGSARVFRLGESGREITLYRVLPGESCILTASCIVNRLDFPAVAVCEQALEALVVPVADVLEWENRSMAWRGFLLASVSGRLTEVIELVDEVVFRRMDQRLAEYLCERADGEGRLHLTHQEIAADLGSSREVVTRMLRDFEQRSILRTGRGEIELLQPQSLERIAAATR